MAALLPMQGGAVAAQAIGVDFAVNQSFTSLESLRSPTGIRVGVHAPSQWGRLGVRAGFRDLSESGGEISGYCGAFFCVDGPFDRAYHLRTLDVGLTYGVLTGPLAEVGVGVSTSFSWQMQRLEHLDTGEVTSRDSVGPDLGLGIFVDLRLRPIALGFRPIASARYEYIRANPCLADGACFSGRHVASLGLGVAWQIE